MKPPILIENDVFWEDENGKRANILAAEKYFDVVVLDHYMKADKQPLADFNFYRGSFGLKYAINRVNNKVAENLNFFNCLYWVPALYKYCINQDYAFVDAAQLKRTGILDKLFVRPCRGDKVFSGQVFDNAKWTVEFDFMTKNMNHSPYELVLVAEPKVITREWRTIFVRNEYVSGALYLENGERKDEPIISLVEHFAKSIANDFYFLNFPNFVVDICECDGKLYLLEINSIYTSSYYSADLDKVYKALSGKA
jgi:hypothetical protein